MTKYDFTCYSLLNLLLLTPTYSLPAPHCQALHQQLDDSSRGVSEAEAEADVRIATLQASTVCRGPRAPHCPPPPTTYTL